MTSQAILRQMRLAAQNAERMLLDVPGNAPLLKEITDYYQAETEELKRGLAILGNRSEELQDTQATKPTDFVASP